jgi:chemotaxis signal transduction protein
LEESAYNDKTRIIIVEDEINKVMIRLGLIVDSVDGVYDIKAEQIESPPDFKKKTESDFVQAVVRDNESVFIILNLLNVMRPPHNN